MVMKKQLQPFKDTLGKRDILKNMLNQNMTLSEICKALGASREELDDHYSDLLSKYKAIEYIPNEEDRKIVWRSAAYGMTQKQICHRLGISIPTLRNYYSRELNTASYEWIDDVATTLVAQAKEGSVPAGIFLLKTRAGWKETQVNELTGKDGGPIQTANMDLTALSDEELAKWEELAQKVAAAPVAPPTTDA